MSVYEYLNKVLADAILGIPNYEEVDYFAQVMAYIYKIQEENGEDYTVTDNSSMMFRINDDGDIYRFSPDNGYVYYTFDQDNVLVKFVKYMIESGNLNKDNLEYLSSDYYKLSSWKSLDYDENWNTLLNEQANTNFIRRNMLIIVLLVSSVPAIKIYNLLK